MKSRLPLAALTSCVILAGCQSSSAAKPAAPAPKLKGTPVPAILRSYSSLVYPLVSGSLAEGRDLLHKMQHDPIASVGNDCTTAGGDISGAQSSFHGTYTPKSASSPFNLAQTGFMLALVATDECGMASDTNSKIQMKTAAADLSRGLGYLSQANATFTVWTGQNTP